MAMEWINLLSVPGATIATVWNGGSPDEDKNITNDGSTFSAPGAYSDGFSAPGAYLGRCLEFTVGGNLVYSGRLRLVLVSNTYSSPYDQYIAYESSTPPFSGNAIPTGTYDYEAEATPTLTAEGGTVVLHVGVGEGGYSGGEAVFQIFVEAEAASGNPKEWVNVHDIPGVGISYGSLAADRYTSDGDTFTYDGGYTMAFRTVDVCSGSLDGNSEIIIALPADLAFTGRQRLTILSNALSRPGGQLKRIHHLESYEDSGAPAPGVYVLDAEDYPCVTAGSTIYTGAICRGGGSLDGGAVWRLELEMEVETPSAEAFWTGRIGCREFST